ncbi:MAG: hypothetical protein QM756_09050 [Polyangiaceae bacterium]
MNIQFTAFVCVLASLCASPAWAEDQRAPGAVGGFVDLEWRAFALGAHLSHGPAFAAGVSLWNGTLRLGIGALNRPGPWNPATFDVTLPDGVSYRGQRRLSLRSDGAMAGVHVAFAFDVPGTSRWSITLPVTLGYGGFGFYLHGDDRNTPDGRRVSEWENELFGGRDSYLGLVVDAGARLNVDVTPTRWLRPYVGLYYTAVPGFDTLVRSSYAGFSAALGIEVGHGL